MFAAAAAFMSSSCSSDEPVPNPGATTETGKYITVNIVTNSTDTRATVNEPEATEGDYSTGSENENGLVENNIKDALFMFFDNSGVFSQQVYRDLAAADNYPAQAGQNQNVEFVSKSTLVLQENKITPTQLMVIINPTADFKAKSYGMSLAQVRAEAENFTNKGTTSTSFVMSNSVYKGTANVQDVVNITGNSSEDQSTAESNPVNVYVERVNGKVTVKYEENNFSVTGTEITLCDASEATGQLSAASEVTKTLKPKILGYSLVNIPKKSYLVKNITDVNFTNWTGWNNAGDFRSFWANNWASTGSDIRCNFRYKDVLAANKNGQSLITTFYPQENTSSETFGGKTDGYYNTQLLVLAQLCDENGPVSFVNYKGLYYTEDSYYDIALNLLKLKGVKTQNNITLDKNVLKIHRVKDSNNKYHSWQVKIYIDYSKGAFDAENVAKAEEVLNGMDIALFWQDGKCYYFTTITHFGKDDSTPAKALKGIVRNHWYQVELTGIHGLGTPVFENDPDNHYDPENPTDPTDPTDPDNPDDPYNPDDEDDNEHTEIPDNTYSFLYAKVNILSWKIVTNKVVLGY